jgi:hypothetical protein
MQIDVDGLSEALRAEYERWGPDADGGDEHIFRFRDAIMRYELLIRCPAGATTLAMDPEKPIQGCPLLEFTFSCASIEIGENVYDPAAGPAVRFWGNDRQKRDIRLTLTPRSDNRWYIWANTWDWPLLDESQIPG